MMKKGVINAGYEGGGGISTIPLICHRSHGYIRVNFFWPV